MITWWENGKNTDTDEQLAIHRGDIQLVFGELAAVGGQVKYYSGSNNVSGGTRVVTYTDQEI